MKRIIALLLAAFLVLAMVGCKEKEDGNVSNGAAGGCASGGSGTKIDPKTDPRILDAIQKNNYLTFMDTNWLIPGEIWCVGLDENQSVPYRWKLVISDKKLLKLYYDEVDSSMLTADTPPGSPGEVHWFYFEALRAGSCTIDMYYADLREKKYTNYEKVTYYIIIEGQDPGAAAPTDAEVEAAYRKADEAFRWFTYTTMPLAEDTITRDGTTWQRVDFPGVTSFDELRDYLMTIFAPNIAAGLVSAEMMEDHYREFDGVLYAHAADGVPGLCFGGTSSEIIRNDDGTITYRVTTDVLDEETFTEVVEQRVHNLTYANTQGTWVFIWFENVYDVN